MIKEYALQPELLSSGSVCRALSEKFGYGIGRVIARYPKRWKQMVYVNTFAKMEMRRDG